MFCFVGLILLIILFGKEILLGIVLLVIFVVSKWGFLICFWSGGRLVYGVIGRFLKVGCIG